MKKIGEICLDTGVLMLGDLTYLKKIKQTPHQSNRQFMHETSKKTYTQNIDFVKYTDVLIDGKTVNELIEAAILTEVKTTNDTELSTENILNDLESGFKQINFDNGAPGKALALLSKEGFYPVYVEMDEEGVAKLVIDFRAEEA